PQMPESEAWVLLVNLLGTVAFVVLWQLELSGLVVGGVARVNLGVVALAWALHCIGVVVIPSWRRYWAEPTPGPRPGDVPRPGLGPLKAIGIGICCGALGLFFLWVGGPPDPRPGGPLIGPVSARALGGLLP